MRQYLDDFNQIRKELFVVHTVFARDDLGKAFCVRFVEN